MTVRRLEAETIRDTTLRSPAGWSEPVRTQRRSLTLRRSWTGRAGRSVGPLDGDGRRASICNVRRNFLNPDVPGRSTSPRCFPPMGRRNVSNVPVQAF